MKNNDNSKFRLGLEGVLRSAGVKDADRLVDNLISKIGEGLRLFNASYTELISVDGVDDKIANLIMLCVNLTSRRITDSVTLGKEYSEEEIREYLKGLYIGISCETPSMLSFDSKNRLCDVHQLSEGTLNASEIYPRKVLDRALRVKASNVIIAHNHPGGNTLSSTADRQATEIIRRVLWNNGIGLTHHYVVADMQIDEVRSEETL